MKNPRNAALGHPVLALAMACGASVAATNASASAGRQLEPLDRGVVAIHTGSGNFIGWRALAPEAASTAFNLYRDGKRLNDNPLTATNFVDSGATPAAGYTVRAMRGGAEVREPAATATTWDQPFLRIALRKPPDGVTPDGQPYSYVVKDRSTADLDGDGRYELLVKWQPTNAHDNAHRGQSGATLVDAYRLDGSFMWRIDLGPNIRAGAHYTTFLAYDFDGDGRGEVMMKTADGSVDGQGKVIGKAGLDHRNKDGYVLAGPEYLTVFDGRSGAALASTDYLPARGDVAAWGDA
jgi:rhamnogalacturonan endolyase